MTDRSDSFNKRNNLPDQIFIVRSSNAALGYGNKAGGTFTSLSHAINRMERIVRSGGTAKLFIADTRWHEGDLKLALKRLTDQSHL